MEKEKGNKKLTANYYNMSEFGDNVELGYRTRNQNQENVVAFPLDQIIHEWLEKQSGINYIYKPWWECEDEDGDSDFDL